jgi:polygalacturonase
MPDRFFDARSYGAIGDGLHKETHALQKAIDACHRAGGGRVLLAAGRYLSGTIFLKSNVELHLQTGAVLLGSPDAEDYNAEDIFPENIAFASENVTARHLVIAYRQENIAITGNGTIDGNSPAFFDPLPADKSATYRNKTGNFPIPNWRPGQMVFLCRCKNVAVRDVRLFNSPYWTLFLLGCNDVQIRGLLIENPPATANGDGIDVDCCRNVTISDCIVRSGDDCLTLRANSRALGENAQPCENVVVSNCVLSTPCNAIRVGVGDGEIRNGLFNNIVIPEASRGISVVSLYRKTHWSQHGTRIENVHFSDFLMDADVPITMGVGEAARASAAMRDISFNRFRVTAWAAAQVVGNAEVPVQRVRFCDCDWTVRGGTENIEFQTELPSPLSHHGYRGRNGEAALPCAIYGADIEGITFENLRLRWDEISPVWRDGIFLERARDVEVLQSTLRQPQNTSGAAVHCISCENIAIESCRAARGTGTFLQAEESAPGTCVRAVNNDWRHAAQALKTDLSVTQ